MTFDPSISLGNILSVLVLVLGGMSVLWSMKGDLRLMAEQIRVLQTEKEDWASRFNRLEAEMRNMELSLGQLARQDERLKAMEERVTAINARVTREVVEPLLFLLGESGRKRRRAKPAS